MASRVNFTTPVGRFVQGDTTKPRTQDFDGKPLVVKTGPNVGQPTQQYFIAIAIPKGTEQGWWQTEWGKIIHATGYAAFPQQSQRPDFAWKVTDGDSMVPNKRGKKPAEQEGHKGCWILKCSSQFAPKCYNRDGTQAVPPETIKCGHYIQVSIDCAGNGNTNNPGVFLNASMVAHSAFGEEINQGPDPTAAGFGAGPAGALPAGALAAPAAPAGGPAFPAPAPGGAPPLPLPGAPAAASTAAIPAPGSAASAPSPAGIMPSASPSNAPPPPNPGFTAVAAPPAPPAPPAVAAAPVGPTMTAKAAGNTYAAMIAAGWTDATLREHGYMV